MSLFNALASSAKVDEVGPQLDAVFFFDPERCQDRRYSPPTADHSMAEPMATRMLHKRPIAERQSSIRRIRAPDRCRGYCRPAARTDHCRRCGEDQDIRDQPVPYLFEVHGISSHADEKGEADRERQQDSDGGQRMAASLHRFGAPRAERFVRFFRRDEEK